MSSWFGNLKTSCAHLVDIYISTNLDSVALTSLYRITYLRKYKLLTQVRTPFVLKWSFTFVSFYWLSESLFGQGSPDWIFQDSGLPQFEDYFFLVTHIKRNWIAMLIPALRGTIPGSIHQFILKMQSDRNNAFRWNSKVEDCFALAV